MHFAHRRRPPLISITHTYTVHQTLVVLSGDDGKRHGRPVGQGRGDRCNMTPVRPSRSRSEPRRPEKPGRDGWRWLSGKIEASWGLPRTPGDDQTSDELRNVLNCPLGWLVCVSDLQDEGEWGTKGTFGGVKVFGNADDREALITTRQRNKLNPSSMIHQSLASVRSARD